MKTATASLGVQRQLEGQRILTYGLGGTLLFVACEVIAATPLAPLFFLGLAVACVLGLLIQFRTAFLSILVLALIQTPYPVFAGYDTELGVNWYTLDIGPLSLIHYISVAVVAVGTLHVMRKGYTATRQHMRYVLLLLLVAVTSLLMGIFYSFGWRELFIELGKYLYLVGYMVIALFVFRDEEGNRRLFNVMTVYIPFAIVLGQAVWQLPRLAGWEPYYIYTTGNAYAFPALVWHAFVSKNPQLRRVSIAVFLAGFGGVAAQVGSSVLLGIVGVLGLVSIRNVRSGKGGRTILVLLMLIAGAAATLLYQIVVQQNMFTLLKINQIIGVFKSSDLRSIPTSTLIRVLELYNITHEISESIPTLLFGHGFGGYFTDSYFPFGPLTDTAYSADQRATGKFYGPHNNPQYVLLKHGFVGAGGWAIVIGRSMLSSLVEHRDRALIGALLVPSLFVLYGWGVNSSLLIGILCALYLLNEPSSA